MRCVSLTLGLLAVAISVGCSGRQVPTPPKNPNVDDPTNPTDPTPSDTNTTVADIQTNIALVNTAIKLSGVVITGVAMPAGAKSTYAWVSDVAGGSASVEVNTGILLFRPTPTSGQLADLKVGDLVDVIGVVAEYKGSTEIVGLTSSSGAQVTPLNSTASVSPAVVDDVPTLASPAAVNPYDGMLVQIKNVKVTTAPDPVNKNEWVVGDAGMHIGALVFDPPAGIAVGDCYASITGVYYHMGLWLIEPRTTADLVKGTGCSAASSSQTIVSIQTGIVATGTNVKLHNVVVTGIATAPTVLVWVADVTGGQSSIAPSSGLLLYKPEVPGSTIAALAVGDLVDVTGMTKEYGGSTELVGAAVGAFPQISKVAGPPTTATAVSATVDPAVLATAAPPPLVYDDMLVKVTNVLVTTAAATVTSDWMVGAANLTIGPTMTPAPTGMVVGDCYASITGLYYHAATGWRVLPRSSADLVKGTTECSGTAPMSIGDVKTGMQAQTLTTGALVSLAGVVITAIEPPAISGGPFYVWVADVSAGATSTTLGSGIMVREPAILGGQLADVKIGDLVDASGAVYYVGNRYLELAPDATTIPLLTPLLATATVAPLLVPDVTKLASPAPPYGYAGMLVQVENIKVTAEPATNDPNDIWVVGPGNLRIGARMISPYLLNGPLTPSTTAGSVTCYASITGISFYDDALGWLFEPRSENDFVAGSACP